MPICPDFSAVKFVDEVFVIVAVVIGVTELVVTGVELSYPSEWNIIVGGAKFKAETCGIDHSYGYVSVFSTAS
ncbi:uncharacterized protein OCT59_023195 [Rhizophagus irregularis]|uniref:uncharacterized protein n=1 Tax=Rhizophagus irregularis TaxID=588596 RepID=UPI001C1C1F6D|nr:hypothetical protein OCT59_023195 [Rhizophagus irregularis]CAB4489302.1 unnamed protein product [Rhizophagus irregularis]CAB5214770.1 unnamed protein product [Rhizophagus irregularis]